MSSQHSPPQGQGDASIPLRSTAMPLNVAHNLPTKSSELSPSADIRRPKRQLPDGRKTRQQRDNIENAPSAAASIQILTSLPVQKQSTKIRKRLTETQPSPYNSDVEPSKRRKVLQTYTAPATVPSALNVTPLHRTLSDKSTYLNQGSVPETNAGLKQSSVKTQSTLASWRMDPRSMHSGSESDDADDEDEISNGNTVRSVVEIQAPSQAFATTDRRQGLISAFGAQPSPAETVSSPSIEDDLFGSDTTLTSPEEDSEDEQETNDASSAQPLEASPLTTPAEEDPSEAMPTPTASPAKRRGPGRPRKNPLPPNTSSSKRRKSQEDIRVSTAEASVLTPPPEQPLSVQPGKYGRSIVSPPPSPRAGKEFTTPKAYGSLMARIIDGKKLLQLEDSEADLSDSSDDTEVVTLVKCKETLSSTHDESLSDTSSRLASPDRIVAPVSDSALGNDTPAAIATSIERAVESVMSKLALIKAESSTKSADHVFAVPAVPLSRPTHATRSSTKAKPVPIKHSGRAFSLTPARRSILKQRHIRPTIRSIPRPRLFQTCLEIMTHPNPTRPRPNVHAMASMLKHFLQRGMCDIQEPKQKVKLLVQDAPLDLASLQAQAWGAVIGNGKGLLQTSTRKQDEQRRVTERRTIVADAYQALNLPPPVENWDKSSKIIAAGLSLDNGPSSTVEGADAQRWSDVRDDTLDHLSRRLGCDYCRKTHSNMNSLLEHMDRCTMAHLQTSIFSDVDGESTASETEDQRKARCPKASREMYGSKNTGDENTNEEYEDEEGIIMCVCGSKEDEGAMVQCDKCKVWLHMECLDLSEDDVPDEYFCPMCLGMPIPSTAGKSFRHIPAKPTKQRSGRRGRPRHQPSSGDSSSDSENDVAILYREQRARAQNMSYKIHLRLETDSEAEEDFLDTDEDGGHAGEGMVSPQVVLNHEWEGAKEDPANEYLSSLFGITTIFKQSRAPALMLDGSSSQEAQADGTEPLLSSGLGHEDESVVVFQTVEGVGLSSVEIELSSEADMTFHDSQPIDYLSSSGSLFEPEYRAVDGYSSDHLLLSEDTIDSEGLRTPVDLRDGSDHSSMWIGHEHEGFVDDTLNEFDLNSDGNGQNKGGNFEAADMDNYLRLATGTEDDLFSSQNVSPNEEFDLHGLIDLEAVSLADR